MNIQKFVLKAAIDETTSCEFYPILLTDFQVSILFRACPAHMTVGVLLFVVDNS
jgi:hypothetical protein